MYNQPASRQDYIVFKTWTWTWTWTCTINSSPAEIAHFTAQQPGNIFCLNDQINIACFMYIRGVWVIIYIHNLKSGESGYRSKINWYELLGITVILTAQTGRSAAEHTNSNDPFCKIVWINVNYYYLHPSITRTQLHPEISKLC